MRPPAEGTPPAQPPLSSSSEPHFSLAQQQQQQAQQQQTQQQEPLKIGDAVCLYASLGLAGVGAGYIHAPQAADGGVFVHPVANRVDPRLDNVQTCVFELYVPWDYKSQKRYTASNERAKALEAREAELTAKLQSLATRAVTLEQKSHSYAPTPGKPHAPRRNGRAAVAPTAASNPSDAEVDGALASLRARQASLREELHVVAAERDVAELEAKRFFKQARADLINNTQEQGRQTGKPLIFGDTIQLRHLFTNMFVRADTSGTASLEYSGLAVRLADESDRACLFRIMPRFKVRAIGDEVHSGDQILLVSERAPGQFLGLSDSTFAPRPGVPALEARLYRDLHEVCVTAVATTWHVQRFSGRQPQEIQAARQLFVRGGDFVQLFDKEKDGYLAADLVVPEASRNQVAEHATPPRPALLPTLAAYLNCGLDEDGGVQEESKTYWQVLFQRRCVDGSVIAGEPPQTIVLRSPILGRFLAVRPAPIGGRSAASAASARPDEANLMEAFLTDSPNDPLAAFELVPFNKDARVRSASIFEDGGYCSLRNVATQTFLHTTRDPLAAVGVQTAQQEREGVQGARARERHSFTVGFTPRPTYEDVFVIRLVHDTDCDDFNLVYSALPMLRVLRDYVQPAVLGALPSIVSAGGPKALLDAAASSPTEGARWATDGPRVVQRGAALLHSLAFFLLDQDADDFEWGKDVYKRQGLLQDLGIFELVVELVSAPLSSLSPNELRSAMMPELTELWEAAFLVLLNGAKGPHSETDRFIARFYKTFFEHTLYLKTEGAAEVVLELITDSRDIIDDLIDQPELGLSWVLGHLDHAEHAVDTVDKDYFDMLRTFCVCDGLAVRRAQELVLRNLFEDDDALRHGHLHQFKLNTQGAVEVTLGTTAPRALASLCQPIASQGASAATVKAVAADMEKEAPQASAATALVHAATPCYFGPALTDTETFHFLLAQLRLYSALADGCYTEAERCIRGVLPLEVVQAAMVCNTLAYDLRAALADLLLELYLDSSDLIGVSVIERPPRCFPASHAAAHASAVHSGVHHTSPEGGDCAGHGHQQAAIKASLHGFFISTFAREARQFTEEMARIMEADDEFEPWHGAHGEYILSILRLVLFFVRNSIYQDPREVGELLQLLVYNIFHVRHQLVGAEVTNHDDARRNDLVEKVLATALDVVAQLLNFHRYHTTLAFVADFEAVYAHMGEKNNRRGRGAAADEKVISAARLHALMPLCEAAYFAANAEIGASSSGADMLRATVPTKAHADAYARELFTATAFERLCGLPSPERGGRSMLKTVLVELAAFPADQVMRRAMRCLTLSSTRHAALRDLVGDALLLVDANSLAAHAVVEDMGPILNDLAHDTQIDEKEAGELLRHLNDIRARLARTSAGLDSVANTEQPQTATAAPPPGALRLPTNVQEVFRRSHVVADILAVFDQTLDDDDLRPTHVTRLQDALAACLDFLGELALDNPGMQQLLFQEMSGLLANVNTRPPHVAAALARALTRVFDEPLNRIQVRESHVEQVVVLTCNLFMAGHPVADLNHLLRRMAEKHGDTFMSTTHALIIRKLMQHEANILRLLQAPPPEADAVPVLRAFYFSLIALLATLSEGENEFVESMCQRFFSVDDLLSMLVRLPGADAAARSALLAFLDTVYLSTHCVAPSRHPITDVRIWDVLATATNSLVSLAARAAHAPPTAEDVDHLDVAVDFLFSFFSLHYQKPGAAEMGLAAQAVAEATPATAGEADDAAITMLSAAAMQVRCSALAAPLGRALIDIAVAGEGQPWMGDVLRTSLLQAVFAILRGATFADQAQLAETATYIQSRAPDSQGKGNGLRMAAAQKPQSEGVPSQAQAAHRRGKRQAVPQRSPLAAALSDGIEMDVLRDAAQGGTPLDEAHLNACFRRFQDLFFHLHWNRNSAHHRCCREDEAEEEELTEEWPCPYLQLSTDGEPSLPNGYEFQRRLALVEAEPALLDCLLRYLAIESDVLDNRNCSDSEREAAATACADALRVLRGLVQLRLCRLSDFDPYDYDGRKQIWDFVHTEQHRIASANAIPHVLRLLCAESEELFTDAFELLASLCAGGNPSVQAMVKRALDDAPDLPCLLRVRDELHRSLALTLQRRATLSAAGLAGRRGSGAKGSGVAQLMDVHGESGSLGRSRGGTFGTFATLSQTQVQELQRAFGTLLRGGARHTALALSAAREREVTAAQCELRWLDTLCRGIMLWVENAFSPMQDHLREQPASSLTSVNFVVEMCRLLQATYTYVTQGTAWLGLLDQILDTLAELCQGSPSNQQEALDEQVVKYINFILAYDTGNEEQLLPLTRTKRGALTVLEAMLESNNAAAVEIANILRASLNLEELYLAMNRFYYLNLFSKVVAERDDDAPASREHLIAGFECYFVLARLGDLTGTVYRWKEASVAKKSANGEVGSGDGGGRASIADAEACMQAMRRRDDDVEERIEQYLEEAAAKLSRGGMGSQAGDRDTSGATRDARRRAKAFVEFSRGALSELDTHGGKELGPTPDRFDYFQLRSASIEFVRNGEVQKAYFRRPDIVLSQRQRDEILLGVNRATPQEKVRDFVQRLPAIRRKLQFQARLQRYAALRLVAEGTSTTWKWISLVLTLALNVLMLTAWSAPESPAQVLPNVPAYYEPAALVLGVLHLATSLGVVTEHYINNVQAGGRVGASDMYYVAFVVSSALGLAFRGFFYSFHLFHIAADNDMLQRAMESVTRNGGALFNVTLLAVAVVFNFSMVAFAFFRGSYERTDGMFCGTLTDCFISTLSTGLRSGGGVGEGLEPAESSGSTYASRVTFELLFWALVCVIGLNLVLGIIVDSFSQLRAERAAKLDDMVNSCFICSLPSHHFDNVDGGFARHIREDHNMWAYVYYVMYLEQETQPFDRTYHELYLYQKLVVELDPAPIPIKRALCLTSAATNADSAVERLAAQVDSLRRDVESGLDALRRLFAAGRAEAGAAL
jgi:hypothetical protein